jgi:hypothetical protein
VGVGVVSGLQTAEGIGFGEFGPCTKLHHIGDHISGHRPPVWRSFEHGPSFLSLPPGDRAFPGWGEGVQPCMCASRGIECGMFRPCIVLVTTTKLVVARIIPGTSIPQTPLGTAHVRGGGRVRVRVAAVHVSIPRY